MKVFTNNCFKWKTFPTLLFAFLIMGFSYQTNAQGEWRMLGEIDSHTDDWSSTLVKDHSGNIYASMGVGMYRFNGTKWSELPGFTTGSYERKIAVNDAGDIYASATSDLAGEYFIAKYNGAGWTRIQDHQYEITALATDATGNLYAASYRNISKWDGTTWTTIFVDNGSGAGMITSMVCDGTGKLYATGTFTGDSPFLHVKVWDGVSWTELAGSAGSPNTYYGGIVIVDEQNTIYTTSRIGNNYPSAVAKWNGSSWIQLGTGTPVISISDNTLAIDAQHNIYATGAIAGGSGQTVLKWNGTSWAELGPNANVYTLQLIVDNVGNVCAAINNYDDMSGTIDPESYIAKWNGTNWTDGLGGGVSAALHTHSGGYIITDRQNNLYRTASLPYSWIYDYPAGPHPQQFYIAKWDGTAWSQATIPDSTYFNVFQRDGNGNFYSTGGWINASGKYYVAKWNGSAWVEPGTGASALNANAGIGPIVIDQQNNVYAAGAFTNSNSKKYVAKWNGSTWAELGSGAAALNGNAYIRSLAIDHAGNIYAAGDFTNASGKQYVAKWNGTTWSELGTGSASLNADATINTLTIDHAGNIYAAGSFRNSSSKVYIAKWNGIGWSELGPASNGFPVTTININGIFQVLADSTGYIYASGGNFTDGNQQTHSIAKWDGVTWSGVVSGGGYYMATDTSGSLYYGPVGDARRYYQVAKFFATRDYKFTGNGNWNNFANWENNVIPPVNLPAGSKITISPANGGQCSLNTIQTISAGALFTVSAGAHFVVTGNLINNQ